jgi:hypothetical protein
MHHITKRLRNQSGGNPGVEVRSDVAQVIDVLGLLHVVVVRFENGASNDNWRKLRRPYHPGTRPRQFHLKTPRKDRVPADGVNPQPRR